MDVFIHGWVIDRDLMGGGSLFKGMSLEDIDSVRQRWRI